MRSASSARSSPTSLRGNRAAKHGSTCSRRSASSKGPRRPRPYRRGKPTQRVRARVSSPRLGGMPGSRWRSRWHSGSGSPSSSSASIGGSGTSTKSPRCTARPCCRSSRTARCRSTTATASPSCRTRSVSRFGASARTCSLRRLDRPLKRIVVASAVSGEGKSTIVRNLALTYLELGLSVVVVEADLRRPTLSTAFAKEAGALDLPPC